jgi:hypothetical protein
MDKFLTFVGDNDKAIKTIATVTSTVVLTGLYLYGGLKVISWMAPKAVTNNTVFLVEEDEIAETDEA